MNKTKKKYYIKILKTFIFLNPVRLKFLYINKYITKILIQKQLIYISTKVMVFLFSSFCFVQKFFRSGKQHIRVATVGLSQFF